jgi:phosphodiesterase/alkaline phosphatase D-like protein
MRWSGVRLTAAVVTLLMLALLAPATARAATGAPVVTTGIASSITNTSAIVSGTVNPHGHAVTDWEVEYGSTTSYGFTVDGGSIAKGSTAVPEERPLARLSPHVTYHYRFIATNASGTSPGGDATFTTGMQPQATTGGVSDITSTSAVIGGVVNPSGSVTAWTFEFGPTTGYGASTPPRAAGAGTASVNVGITVNGLSPATTYHYRLVATSNFGTATGSDETFRTGAAPSVTTGAATSTSDTATTLTGSVEPMASTTSVAFEYGTSSSYDKETPVQVVDPSASVQHIAQPLTGLDPKTTYHYRLVAVNANGTSSGNDETVTTAATSTTSSSASSSAPSSTASSSSGAVSSSSPSSTSTTIPAGPANGSTPELDGIVPLGSHSASGAGTTFWVIVVVALLILVVLGGVGGYFVITKEAEDAE